MTTSSVAGKTAAHPTPVAAGWLGLAASPTFAVMGLVAAHDASSAAICLVAPGVLPVDGMTAMYVLMCLFHLPPWLKFARHRPWGARPEAEGE
jgi:hypothetical protein